MKRHCKLIISTITVALIFTLVLSPCSFALGKQQFGAWIASALTALNIVTSSTFVPYYNFVDDYLTDPFSINEQTSGWDYLPYTWEDTDDFYDRSVLKIDKDIITIDGVDYTDIWLSNDASEKFRTNAFDLVSAWDIASQSQGTFVSGEGNVDGLPIFGYNGGLRSQNYSLPYDINNYYSEEVPFTDSYVIKCSSSGSPKGKLSQGYRLQLPGASSGNNLGSLTYTQVPGYLVIDLDANQNVRSTLYGSDGVNHGRYILSQLHYTAEPFDFDWVAGTIPLDTPLAPEEGIRIRVPTQDVQPWYTQNPDVGPNVTINMGDPELENKIDDLIDLIIPLIPVVDIDFVEYDAPEPEPIPEPIPVPDPYPDPDPQPGTVIPDLDWSDLFQTIKNIYNKISEHVSISTAIKNILDKIKWFLDDFFGDLGDILNNLPDIFERHVIDTIRRGLTGLKNIFLPILALLRNALGIWHYVVEWFQAISTPFSFYLNLLGQGYPLITVPIYAAIAGIIVIAVYRRFGR